MKENKSILRSVGLMMLCLVWVTSVFGKPMQMVHHEKTVPTKQPSKHQNKQQPTITVLQDAVVVPSHAFSFVQDFIVLPTPQFIFVVVEKIVIKVEKPFFLLSYFQNLFEHHIAINAP